MPAGLQLGAEIQVLGDRAVGEQVELLVDDADAGMARLQGMGEGDHLTVEGDRATARLMSAGDDLHQRRLAGSVLADDGMDLAGDDVEVDIGEHRYAVETLRHAAQRQPWLPR